MAKITEIPQAVPHFLLIANDRSSASTIRFYAEICQVNGCSREFVAGIHAIADKFRNWRQDHGSISSEEARRGIERYYLVEKNIL